MQLSQFPFVFGSKRNSKSVGKERPKPAKAARLTSAVMPELLESRTLMSATYGVSVAASFGASVGIHPDAGLVAVNGNFYGTTSTGGTGADGTVYEYNPTANSFTVLANFHGSNGAGPEGSLIDVGGNLYGTTSSGGSANDGTVFEYNFGTKQVTTLATFHGSNGSDPRAGLVDLNGNLYGTTSGGGASSDGTVFVYSTGSGKLSTLVSFHGTNGLAPLAGLLVYNNNLYGTTIAGGSSNDGTVFEYNTTTGVEAPVANFHGSNGSDPQTSLIDVGGNLYGTTCGGGSNGAGTIFELNTTTNSLSTLVSAPSGLGSQPGSDLTDYNGNFYGTTYSGTLFEYDPASKGFETIATLDAGSGSHGNSDVVVLNGSLYGTTYSCDSTGDGTVFKYVDDPLIQKYLSLGGPTGTLGAPTSAETTYEGGVGAYQLYKNGAILCSVTYGPFEVNTATANEFLATAGETDANGSQVQAILGFPTSNESPIPNVSGAYKTTFSGGGAIYCSTTTGAHALIGAIAAKYNAVNGPSVLGLPTNDEAAAPDGVGRYVHFESVNGADVGAIDWTATTGAHDVHGQVAAEFKKVGWEKIGEATTDEIDIVGGSYLGEYNRFATEKVITTNGVKSDVPVTLSAVNWTNQNGGSLTGGPSYTDISQGNNGTCWIDASIASLEAAGEDVANLITYEGNNTYEVSLHNWTDPAARPTGGTHAETESVSFNGTTYSADLAWNTATPSQSWALIMQRAVIQALHDWAPDQTIQNPHSGGAPDAQAILTGVTWTNVGTSGTAAEQALESDLADGKSAVFSTGTGTTLVQGHAYAVVSANASGVTLYNPWGTGATASGQNGKDPFTVSWAVIAEEGMNGADITVV